MNALDQRQISPQDQKLAPPVGAVMVVGGGISGMQASLDLANQGFKVYLVEKKSAIGGHMAQLDKTFPTNDCAMCNISPKLVTTGRHRNIEILTNTEVMGVEGDAGNFKVSVKRAPRYIDTDKCISCGDCATVCPVSVSDQFEEGLSQRKAAYKLYSQAVPSAYAIDKLGTAPCRSGCPAGQRAQGYIALIAEGRYKEAFQVIKEDNPFPSVCGRTCHHPCESKCSRSYVDQAVGIMSLKRFVTDYTLAYGRERVEPVPRTRPEWVAVVGSGPAGLTAAHDLAKKGYGVTVYEALPVAGGMMRVGIPAHRLPKGTLQQDIDDILSLGVVLKTNSPIEDPSKLLAEGYDAVCLATGISTRDHSLGIPGEDARGVISAATFLRKINLGDSVQIGDRVAVVGGGITALDAAAVARRLGSSKVYLALDRPRGELPAYQLEIAAVEAEGIVMLEKRVATRVITENDVAVGIELAETGKGMVKDASGRRKPKIKPGTETIFDIDTVIGTVSQFSDLTYLAPEFDDLEIDQNTLASQIPGVFVVGGKKTGASYIIEAVALGHKVAESIDRYLQNQPLDQIDAPAPPTVKLSRQEVGEMVFRGGIIPRRRVEPKLLPMEERVTSFREVVLGLTEHQARAEAQRCLQCGICSECLACVQVCGVDAIDHDMVAQEEIFDVGAVILAPGYQIYQADHSEEFGLGRYPNVIASLQLERMLSASGPTKGHVQRPSDGRVPGRIAFLQCIGSRDKEHDYCSAVCCMYATKEATIAKEHHPGLEVDVFFMDMRAFSKGYWGYFERSKERYGVNYIRSRISMLREDSATNDLLIEYQNEDGQLCRDDYDLVVLSVGMEISESVKALGQQLGIQLDEYGFCHTAIFDPLETSREGIYAVGPFREPKDIPESVIEASGAAAAVSARIADSRNTLITKAEYPPEHDQSSEEPRVGVFVCHCGSNIAGFVDVEEVKEHALELPGVVHAETNLYSCSQDSIKQISETAKEQNLNRVVVASCTPLTHKPLFQDSIRAAGMNKYLFEMANIRNQCSWVHSDNKEVATEKAKDLVRIAVARANRLQPQYTVDVPVTQSGLVVGGGPAGMTAAISLAKQGFSVDLVEISDQLGGNLRKVFIPHNGKDPQEILSNLVKEVKGQQNIKVHLNSEIVETGGFSGNFTTTIRDNAGTEYEISHGATILAVGGQEYRGGEYDYGKHENILTQQELEKLIHQEPGTVAELRSIVIIQCVGPAEQFCSRICCTVALKNALAIKSLNPAAQIVVLYRDIRSYGFKERLYTQAREKGIIFLRYTPERKPIVGIDDESGNLVVTAWDHSLGCQVSMRPDKILLSMPVMPGDDTQKVAAMFKVPSDDHGFLLEAHVKLRPVDFPTEGIFMAGMVHYPKLLDETMIQAKAAAARAATILSQETITAGGRVATVDPLKCTGCLTCVRVCPFGVPLIQANLTGVGSLQGAAYIEASVCQGCGSCVAECPAYAIELRDCTTEQISGMVSALLHKNRPILIDLLEA